MIQLATNRPAAKHGLNGTYAEALTKQQRTYIRNRFRNGLEQRSIVARVYYFIIHA
jgi:hypothetical protein